jgi:hypothetical protein
MSPLPPVKLVARNVAAARRGRAPQRVADIVIVAGNPMSTRLESGIGNCFPGLECDLRNLEHVPAGLNRRDSQAGVSARM